MQVEITVSELRNLIKEEVTRAIEKALVTEMAYSLSDYKRRAEDRIAQILTNWCLIRYTDYDERYQKLRKHWSSELLVQMQYVSRMRLKKGDDETKQKALYTIWSENEFDRDENVIDGIVCAKFMEEGIDTYSEAYIQTISDCKDATRDVVNALLSPSVGKIIHYISSI